MPRKASGEIKTSIVRDRQKNGDIYIRERQYRYNPETKNNDTLQTKLIAKIPKGETEPVPTRAKRPNGAKKREKEAEVNARREHVGMMAIIDHIGNVSGIDDAIYASTDIATAQKIISLARYLFATNGQSLPGIETWQLTHPIPYEYGISEDVYHKLFKQIGIDETLQQNFFRERCKMLPQGDTIAYDSTTISTYSGQQIDARYGHNKSGDGLKVIKFLVLYSLETRQPIAFTKQPGNLPDVITIANALKQLNVLDVNVAEIVTDNGYYSEANLSEMLQHNFNFITLAKINLKWVKAELDAHLADFDDPSTVCPFDAAIQGITITLMHTFEKERKNANRRTGAKKGDIETFDRRIYLHLYFNCLKHPETEVALREQLAEIKSQLENGVPFEELTEFAQDKAKKFMLIQTRGQKATATYDMKAIREANKYHGYFALVSNKEKDCFECLRKYRKREEIEECFEAGKQRADGTRPRVWDTDTLRGRMFVQFVNLCYQEAYYEMIRQLKTDLEARIYSGKIAKTTVDDEKKLKTWLDKTPAYLQLQWFDTVDCVDVSTPILTKRWNTETTKRDRLFLNKLGMEAK